MSWGTFLSGECISVTAQELAVGKMETKSSIFCDCCLSCCDTVLLPPKIKCITHISASLVSPPCLICYMMENIPPSSKCETTISLHVVLFNSLPFFISNNKSVRRVVPLSLRSSLKRKHLIR